MIALLPLSPCVTTARRWFVAVSVPTAATTLMVWKFALRPRSPTNMDDLIARVEANAPGEAEVPCCRGLVAIWLHDAERADGVQRLGRARSAGEGR